MNRATDLPVAGTVEVGELIELAWPDLAEYRSITDLRNRDSVRVWFLDDRLLDPAKNATWLATGMRRPFEALFSIRWRRTGLFLGICGWSDWDPLSQSIRLGRIAISTAGVRTIRSELPPSYSGISRDAGAAVCRVAFERLGVETAVAYCLASNVLSDRLLRHLGFREVSRPVRVRPDGRQVDTIEMVLTRDIWARQNGARSRL